MRWFVAFILMIVFVSQSLAQTQRNPGRMVFDFTGDATIMGDASKPAEEGTRLYVEYQGRLTMGLLMGEPVIMVRMKYDILGGSVTIPTLEPGESKYETIDLDQIPSVARDLIGIYNMKMVFHFATPGREDVRILEDGGAFMRAGEYSFNVPGSPNWAQVFITSFGDFTDRGIEYMTRDQARQFWGQGLSIIGNEIHDADIALYDLHNWWARNNTIPEFNAAMKAVKRIRDGIWESYRYDNVFEYIFEGRPEQDLAYEYARKGGNEKQRYAMNFIWDEGIRLGTRENYFIEYGTARDHALAALEKLKNLPPQVRIGNNHAPYRQSLKDAEEILEQTQRIRRSFQAEGVDPDTLPLGRPQRMEGVYVVVVQGDERIIVEEGTNREIRVLDSNEVLVQDSFVVRSGSVPCSGGIAQIPARNPESGDVMTALELPCQGSEVTLDWHYETEEDENAGNITGISASYAIGSRQTFAAPPRKFCQMTWYTSARTPIREVKISLSFEVLGSEDRVYEETGSVGSPLCLRQN